MQSSFDRSLAAVLRHEGGYSNHPADNGGPTNKGITLANFRRYVKADGTVTDLKALTTEQAAAVYRRQYWDAVSGAVLPAGVDYAVFDFAVNSGPGRAIKFLQQIVGTKVDTRMGPQTLAAVEAMPAREIIDKLCANRLSWLKRLDDWPSFGKGWTSRVAGVRKLALQLAAEGQGSEPVPTPEPQEPTPTPAEGWQIDWKRVGIAAALAALVLYALFKTLF